MNVSAVVPGLRRAPGPTRRLFRKYALVVAGLVGGALFVSGLLELAFTFQENSASIQQVQREKAATAAIRISAFMTETVHQISWTTRPAGATLDQRTDDYLRLLRIAPAVTDVHFIDGRGIERLKVSRISLNAVDPMVDRSTDDAFVLAQSGATYFSPIYYRTESEPYITMSQAEPSSAGGVTVADVNLKLMWDVITATRTGDRGYAYVIDQDGQLIAHRDISRVLRRSNYSNLPQVQLAMASRQVVPTTHSQPHSATVVTNPDGTQVLSAYELIEPPGWWVFVEQPLQEAFAPLITALVRTSLLLLAGLALSIAASLTLARRMVRPIQALEVGAARIGAGALDQPIQVSTGDELESLASAFNDMAGKLARSRAELEEQVAQRTADLVAALRELEVASQHKSEFLASMSHELRTPLNAVIGFSEMVVHEMVGPLNERQHEYLHDVLTSGRHLLALINDMLDLAKIESGKLSLDRTTFSVADVIKSAAMLMRESATQHQLRLTVEVAPDIGQVSADERKVKQVLINLLANAVKFTPDGGDIVVSAQHYGQNEVAITVRDTGVGLTPEDELHIFDAFVQGDANRNPLLAKAQGTGLGLTLARKFVELHGGRIWVESELGVGSAFTFALPLTQPRTQPRLTGTPRIVGSGPLILLVEDDAHAVELLSFYLCQSGFSVAVTDNATDALEFVEAHQHPVAITLDILLPGSDLDGWDLLGRLKSTPATAGIPVIVVSIVDEPSKGFALGASEYLVKPLRRGDLLSAIARLGLAGGSTREAATILLMEHDEADAERLRAALSDVGCDVTIAGSADAGLSLAQSGQWSLIVIDLLLPDVDGIAVAEAVRSFVSTSETPLLILTPHPIEDAAKIRLRNSVEFLTRGQAFGTDAFLTAVRRLQPLVVA